MRKVTDADAFCIQPLFVLCIVFKIIDPRYNASNKYEI